MPVRIAIYLLLASVSATEDLTLQSRHGTGCCVIPAELTVLVLFLPAVAHSSACVPVAKPR